MKMIYQFLIVCSVFIFSFQVNCNTEGAYVVSDCMDRSIETNGYTCCFYNGTYKNASIGYMAQCAEFPKDEVVEHRKEVKNKLLAGNYWSKVTNDNEIMSNMEYFYCQSDQKSSYITIGFLAYISLLFLLF